MYQFPDEFGRYGEFGGKYVPETLMQPLAELQEAFEEAIADSGFMNEYRRLLSEYSGRPTALTYAENVSEKLGGAKIFLKERI